MIGGSCTKEAYGERPDAAGNQCGPIGCGCIYISRAAGGPRDPVLHALITIAAFVPLFTMQGVEGQIFDPMARTYGYALLGALIATFTVTPVLASLLLPEDIKETETIVARALHAAYSPVLNWALDHRRETLARRLPLCSSSRQSGATRLGTEFLPALEEGNLWIRASLPPTMSLEAGMPAVAQDARDSADVIRR